MTFCLHTLVLFLVKVFCYAPDQRYARVGPPVGPAWAEPGREIQFQERAGPKGYRAGPVFCKHNFCLQKLVIYIL